MKKNKIFIVTSMAGLGGTENVSARILELLNRNNHETWLVSSKGPLVNECLKNGSKWINTDFYENRISGYIKSTALLAKEIKKNQPDIIHCQMARPVIACFIAKILTRSSAKIIWHSRGLHARTYKIVPRIFSALKIHAIGNCRHEYDKLLRNGFNRRYLSYTYNPLPKVFKAPCLPSKKEARSFTLGSLSRLSPDRNIEEALYIFKEVYEKDKTSKLIIGGDGPAEYKCQLENLAKKLEIEKNVIFLGRITSLDYFFSSIDVLINTIMLSGDNGAGVGNNILESAAFKKPVVCYDSCGIKEIVVHGKTGYCVENGARKNFISSILKIKDNPDLHEKLGRNLNRHVKRLCSDEKIYSDLIKSYSK